MGAVQASGVGSMPGEDDVAYGEAIKVVVGELGESPGLVHLPELPGRGATATMTGRGVAILGELDADLQPAGWRLTGTTGAPGLDQRRARSLLAQDLDGFEEALDGFTGPVKVQLIGPWTLAATIERPRGDKALADHGLRRDLSQAYAEGIGEHLRSLRRRLPAASGLIVQLDEPAIGAVLNAKVPTASGFSRHRAPASSEVAEAVSRCVQVIRDQGGEAWVHSCAPGTPWSLLAGSGIGAMSVDVDQLSADDLDVLAEMVESGRVVALGVLAGPPGTQTTAGQLLERAQRLLDLLGLDLDEVHEQVILTPACGMASWEPAQARAALRLLGAAAR